MGKVLFEVNGKMVDGQGQVDGKPLAEAGKVESGAAEVEGLRQELAAAQHKAANQAEIIERGTADNKRLIREAGESNDNSFRLKAELDKAQQELATLASQLGHLNNEVLPEAKRQQDADRAKLTDALARPVMPADARERLIAVNGINAALADKALDALKTDPGQ